MSIQSMIGALNVPYGQAGTMFVDPNAATAADYKLFNSKIDAMFPTVTDPAAEEPVSYSLSDSFKAVSDETDTYTADKLSRLPTEMPMLVSVTSSAAALESSAKQTDEMLNSEANVDDQISNAFPKSDSTTAPGCPDIRAAFEALTAGVKDALSGAKEGLANAYDALSSTAKKVIESVMGVIKNGAEFLEKFKDMAMEEILAIRTKFNNIISSVEGEAREIIDGIKQSVSAATEFVRGKINEFKDVVAKEVQAVKDAVKFLTDFNFLKMFNATNPCVKELLGKFTDSSKVDETALKLINGQATSVDTPVTNAIEIAASVQPMGGLPPSSHKLPPPIAIPDAYTPEQLENMYTVKVTYYSDEVQKEKAAAAKWLKENVEDWKVRVNFKAKQVAAGANDANPTGTTTDPKVEDEWLEVLREYIRLTQQYNEEILPSVRDSLVVYKAVLQEFSRRKSFGKYPYTTLREKGSPIPTEEQTDYLDPGHL